MNKKGLTLTEIIISIAIISIVMTFMFQVLFTIKNGNDRQSTKTDTMVSNAIITKEVQRDLKAFGLKDNINFVIDCSSDNKEFKFEDTYVEGSLNQIIPKSARENKYYCVKIIYNSDNVKNNEAFLIFYENNEKGFLSYKRGKTTGDKTFYIETQTNREIDAIPSSDNNKLKLKIEENSSVYSLKIVIPVLANDANRYDLAVNYISSDLDEPIKNKYTVTFNSNGGSTVASKEVNYNTSVTKPVDPTKSGYTFKEWQLNGEKYDFENLVTDNITLIAEWTQNKYTVTFNSNGGSAVASKEVNYNTSVTKPDDPTKSGYTFKEWQLNGEKYDFSSKVTKNITLTAKWQAVCSENAFENDDWKKIDENINSGNTECYKVGDTKCISLSGLTAGNNGCSGGKFKVRLANNSNYDCPFDSKTACGFVVEFVDVISLMTMHDAGSYNSEYFENGWNLKGWPSTKVYSYLNTDTNSIFKKLPDELQGLIVPTRVVSGHGSFDGSEKRNDGNWESDDYLYLLSTQEIWSDCINATNNCHDSATSSSITRQLDYYAGGFTIDGILTNKLTTSNYNEMDKNSPLKKMNGKEEYWWLRTANYKQEWTFLCVANNGNSCNSDANAKIGVSPAFRLGK